MTTAFTAVIDLVAGDLQSANLSLFTLPTLHGEGTG